MHNSPPIAPATARNAPAILGVLQAELSGTESVLEIGSGTGQHAVRFAAEMPGLHWHTSDLAENHAGIHAHIDAAKLRNIEPPFELDVRDAVPGVKQYDAVYTCNTLHIMSFAAVEKTFAMVSALLPPGGLFCVYGPFRVANEFNTASNAAFDESLRARDADMGIRDLEAVEAFATAGGMRRIRCYAMPANNLMLIWKKADEQ